MRSPDQLLISITKDAQLVGEPQVHLQSNCLFVYKPTETQVEKTGKGVTRSRAQQGCRRATSQHGPKPPRPAPSGKRARRCNCSANILERDHDTRTACTPERRCEFGTGSRVARPSRDAARSPIGLRKIGCAAHWLNGNTHWGAPQHVQSADTTPAIRGQYEATSMLLAANKR